MLVSFSQTVLSVSKLAAVTGTLLSNPAGCDDVASPAVFLGRVPGTQKVAWYVNNLHIDLGHKVWQLYRNFFQCSDLWSPNSRLIKLIWQPDVLHACRRTPQRCPSVFFSIGPNCDTLGESSLRPHHCSIHQQSHQSVEIHQIVPQPSCTTWCQVKLPKKLHQVL